MLSNIVLILIAVIIGRIAALLWYRARRGRWRCACSQIGCDGFVAVTTKKLDGKFRGVIIKNKDGSQVPEDQWIVFLAKDNAVLPMLEFYRGECQCIGADHAHIDGIDALIRRVKHWRIDNRDLCKIPDVEPGELLLPGTDQC